MMNLNVNYQQKSGNKPNHIINMNTHGKFWLTFLNIYTLIIFFIGIILISQTDNRIWLLMTIPSFIFFIAQFIVNYTNLTEK